MASDFWKQLSRLTYADLESLKESGAREKTSLDYKSFDENNLPLPREKLAPILASFANSGGGRLVFGAKEKDERIVAFEGAPKSKSRAITASIRNAGTGSGAGPAVALGRSGEASSLVWRIAGGSLGSSRQCAWSLPSAPRRVAAPGRAPRGKAVPVAGSVAPGSVAPGTERRCREVERRARARSPTRGRAPPTARA
jgi:hypothetical protein